MWRLLVILGVLIIAPFAKAQDLDPLAVMQGMLREHLQEDAQRRENQRMRLELERLDLEKQLMYRRQTDSQLMEELMRYCPSGEPPCIQSPPAALLQEAGHRGLVTFLPKSQQAPERDCLVLGLGGGDALLDCQ